MRNRSIYSKIIIFLIWIGISDCRLLRGNQMPLKDGSTYENIVINGKTRNYWFHVPKQPIGDRQKLPLILVLHGRLGNGKNILEDSKFNAVSDKEGFFVAYPDGYNRSWADGRGATPADREKIDDVLFLEKLIDHLSELFPIASDRIFIVGHSNGGFMTQRMLIEKSKRFRAGVSVASQISEFVLKNFEPQGNVSVAFINGTDDPTVPYYGGYVRDGGQILGVEDSVNRWLAWNSCSKNPKLETRDAKDDNTKLEIRSYDQCKGKTSVRLYKVIGGGHNWPGIERKIPFIGSLGTPTYELDTAEDIWSFFRSTWEP
ncbi:alpha/beta hydrolase family esterase [Leptospira yasudae]|nr:prolyl oligopeptidase family serine peptidase [Leptospira yasudae]